MQSTSSTRRATTSKPTTTATRTTSNKPSTASSTTTNNSAKKEDVHKKGLISTRLNPHKLSNPFTTKNKHKTNFGVAYDAGEIPCRIGHTGNKMFLQWDSDPQDMSYAPIIVTFAEGLRETQHPYVFLARQGLKELLGCVGATEKLASDKLLCAQLCNTIRLALMDTSKEADTFDAALDATESLSLCLGEYLTENNLDKILIQISRKSFDKKYNTKIMTILSTIDQVSNEEVRKQIRKKVPTFQSR